MSPPRHGDGPPAPLESILWDDHELGLVHADPHAYMLAHPCECEALCTCDGEDPAEVSADEVSADD